VVGDSGPCDNEVRLERLKGIVAGERC